MGARGKVGQIVRGAAGHAGAAPRRLVVGARARRLHRALALLASTLLILAVLSALEWFGVIKLFTPVLHPEKAEWRDQVQAVLVLLGLPAAFLLWHWRDSNVREQIENQRKDINLKEFQEVQLRASGALAETLPPEAREQLQIAALHQLRGFLRGEYGESFRRPAFELLLAGHAATVNRVGHLPAIRNWMDARSFPHGSCYDELNKAMNKAYNRLSTVDRERLKIISFESEIVFRSNFLGSARRFDWISLSPATILGESNTQHNVFAGAYLKDLAMSDMEIIGANFICAHLSDPLFDKSRIWWCDFCGAWLWDARFEGSKLYHARFDGANLRRSRFRDATFEVVKFDGANLESVTLENAVARRETSFRDAAMRDANLVSSNMARTDFSGSDLRGVRLEGANLAEARFDGANLAGASFDASTILAPHWDTMSETERDVRRGAFTDMGAALSSPPQVA